jgi:hypothetical protein
MEENRIRDDRIVPSQEHRSAADIVMDPLGDIRPQIDEFKRGAEARVFLTPRALNTIQSYLPGQNLAYFRDPVNRLHIFRSGLIEVLKKLHITTFTREEVFAALRANQTDCLKYMFQTHPTMVRDHAKKYTANGIIRQLRTNEPVGVLEHMNRLHPTMFEEADLQPECYTHLLSGYRHHPRQSYRNFIETFKLLNLRIGVMIPTNFLAAMAHDYAGVHNDVIHLVLDVVIFHNPSQRVRLVPDNMRDLVIVYTLLTGSFPYRDQASRSLRDLINTYVLHNDIFPRIVRQYYRDNVNNIFFTPLRVRDTEYLEFFVDLVREGNPARVIPVINEIPRELNNFTRYLIDFATNVDDLRQSLMDRADDMDGDDIASDGRHFTLYRES